LKKLPGRYSGVRGGYSNAQKEERVKPGEKRRGARGKNVGNRGGL